MGPHPGGMEKAIGYYLKTIALEKKRVEDPACCLRLYLYSIRFLADCYLKMDRMEEALGLNKNACEEIGRERIGSDHVLGFTIVLQENSKIGAALAFLAGHLDDIESGSGGGSSWWDKQSQGIAYGQLAHLYSAMNEYKKSIVYGEQCLALAQETNDGESINGALNLLGTSHGHIGDHANALKYLQQHLDLITSTEAEADDRGNTTRIIAARAIAYSCMGNVMFARGGREHVLEAIDMYQKACIIYTETEHEHGEPEGTRTCNLSETHFRLGRAYREIGVWEDAIQHLLQSISFAEALQEEGDARNYQAQAHQVMGQIYLDRYCTNDDDDDASSLLAQDASNSKSKSNSNNSLHRDEILGKAAYHSRKAYELHPTTNLDLSLDLTQEEYFQGHKEEAKKRLETCWNEAIASTEPLFCQECHQTSAKDATMEKCSGCMVARYCSRAHQEQAWKRGRICHEDMCPLLNRWRKMKDEGTADDVESCNAIFNDFFENILVGANNE